MPVLRVNDRQHALAPGKTRLGGGADVDVVVSADEGLGLQAIIETTDVQVVIRKAGYGLVKVNGVALGMEPTPLMHGDKVEIGGQELQYAEDAQGGTTQYVNKSEVSSLVQKRAGAARATTGTGGRLVSLVDGKEYAVPVKGITIGREAGSDVVVAQNEVSRRHAEIVPSERGYLIYDHSTNGVYVNGNRVQQSQLLARSDVVRVGTEEFRFYADVMPASAAPGAAVGTAAPVGAAPAARLDAPPPAAAPAAANAPRAGEGVATERVSAVPDSMPAAAPAAASGGGAATPSSARPVVATLEIINEGVNKGKRFDISVPLAHVGRGAHNDVAIDDDSVSDIHAKLQRREDGWYLVDLGSTNGTYVGGSRVTHERRLDGMPDVRFGGVKLVFRAVEASGPGTVGKGTRAIAGMPLERPKVSREPKTAVAGRSAPREAARAGGTSIWTWLLILVAAAAAAFYFLK